MEKHDAQHAAHMGLTPPVGEHDHIVGPASAPVTLVAYGDYECPDTAAALPVIHQLRHRLGDQLRFVYRYFPLTNIHPHALHAAEAAEAAAAQGKFWTMHDYLFAHQDDLRDAALAHYAAAVGLDHEQFVHDMVDHATHARVRADMESGRQSGVEGTPRFFINGVLHESWDLATLAPAVERAAHG